MLRPERLLIRAHLLDRVLLARRQLASLADLPADTSRTTIPADILALLAAYRPPDVLASLAFRHADSLAAA